MGETIFEPDGISDRAGFIYHDYQSEQDSQVMKQSSVWTYAHRYVLCSEKLEFRRDGFFSKVVHGPYEFPLEDYHEGDQR